MPTLERKKDGDYYIRAYSRSQECIMTWQVRGSGLTYLNGHGVYAGKRFSTRLLLDMIDANHVFTGSSGIHQGSVSRQSRPTKPIPLPVKKTTSMNNSFPRVNNPRKSKGNTRPDAIIRSTTSLVFRKYKKRWELLIVFPKIFVDASTEQLFMGGCCLTVVGATNTLKTKQLLPNRGEASLTVIPQIADYVIKLGGTGPSCENLWSLLRESKNVMREVKGLSPSGTVFKAHNEVLPWKEGTRLNKQVPMIPDQSYFVVFHKSYEPNLVLPTLKVKNFGNIGMWEAWEIQFPVGAGTDLSS